MTQNQLRYWTLEETKRANKEQEYQTRPLREAQTKQQEAQAQQFYAQVDKMLQEIKLMKSQKELTNHQIRAQTMENIAKILNMFSNWNMLPTWWNTEETRNIGSAAGSIMGGIGKLIG